MKPHFLSSIIFTVLYTIQTITPSLKTRMNLIAPVMILFFGTFVLFIIDYEKTGRKAWSKKEKKLIESSYEKFYMTYLISKKQQETDTNKAIEEEKKKWLDKRVRMI